MRQLQALVLAAGSSRRFPSNKLLRLLPDGRCLLDVSYQLAQQLAPRTLTVINSDPSLRSHCETHGMDFIINDAAPTGLASSIVCGVNASIDADGWAIFLADMPAINPVTLQLLAETWSSHAITLPRYQQQHGHPVIFSKDWAAQLCALQGDQGARHLLRDNPAVYHLDSNDAGVCFDIDTEEDWNAYLCTKA